MTSEDKISAGYKLAASTVVLITLLLVPSPLLPPHRFAEAVQSISGVSWKAAYLVAAVGLQAVFFCSIGVVSAFVVKRASTLCGRLIQITVMPIVIVVVALIIRSVKMGHFPV